MIEKFCCTFEMKLFWMLEKCMWIINFTNFIEFNRENTIEKNCIVYSSKLEIFSNLRRIVQECTCTYHVLWSVNKWFKIRKFYYCSSKYSKKYKK